MRILLTGASGFVGSHALARLLEEPDVEVVCPVTFRHRGLTDRIRLVLDDAGPEAASRVKVIRTDLSAPISKVTDHEFGHIDAVLNIASESHVDRSIDEPADFIINNVSLMCYLLDWARTREEEGRGVRVIVQTSTDEVYGPAPDGYNHKEWETHYPSNPYSASKSAQESILFSYWRTYNLPCVVTNTMNIVGHMQDPEKFVPKTISAVTAGKKVTVHASPEGVPGSRFYLHAYNQADGLLHILRWALEYAKVGDESLRYSDGGLKPFRFNIVGEREVDNLEMAQMLADAAGKKLDYELVDFHSSRPGHDLRYALDGAKLAATGWTPPIPLERSLQDTVDWSLAHPEWLDL